MKDGRNVLIICDAAGAIESTFKKIIDAGITEASQAGGTHSNAFDCIVVSSDLPCGSLQYKFREKEVSNGVQCSVYHYTELTKEIVATFPGAKPVKPEGPFDFEGRMWEIDGDEKGIIQQGELFLTEDNNDNPNGGLQIHQERHGRKTRWLLRPLISAEKQNALDDLAKLEENHTAMAQQIIDVKTSIEGMN